MKAEVPKPYLSLKGMSVLERTLSCFIGIGGLRQIVVATSESYRGQTSDILQNVFPNVETLVVSGGKRRQDSIYNALLNVPENVDLVAVHDAVRPFVSQHVIINCLNAAAEIGGAIVGVPVKDTIKQIDEELHIQNTPDRSTLWQAQTPQIFKRNQFLQAYNLAKENHVNVTDDASLFEAAGMDVKLVQGERGNFKITYPIDFKIAEILADTFNPRTNQ